MVLEDLGPLGPARLFALARILLHGQVVLGLIGSLSFVYGTIHPGERVTTPGKRRFRATQMFFSLILPSSRPTAVQDSPNTQHARAYLVPFSPCHFSLLYPPPSAHQRARTRARAHRTFVASGCLFFRVFRTFFLVC